MQIQDLNLCEELTMEEVELIAGGAVGFVTGVAVGTYQTGVKAWFSPGTTNWGEHFTSLAGTTAITTGLGGVFGGPKGAALSH